MCPAISTWTPRLFVVGKNCNQFDCTSENMICVGLVDYPVEFCYHLLDENLKDRIFQVLFTCFRLYVYLEIRGEKEKVT